MSSCESPKRIKVRMTVGFVGFRYEAELPLPCDWDSRSSEERQCHLANVADDFRRIHKEASFPAAFVGSYAYVEEGCTRQAKRDFDEC